MNENMEQESITKVDICEKPKMETDEILISMFLCCAEKAARALCAVLQMKSRQATFPSKVLNWKLWVGN